MGNVEEQVEIIARNVEGYYETLEGHIGLCLDKTQEVDTKQVHTGIAMQYEDLAVKQWLETQLLETIIIYHDMGKRTNAFQDRVKHNTQKAVSHALPSSVCYLYESLQLLDEEDPHIEAKTWWLYLLSFVISQHHGVITVNRLYGYESTLKKYIEKGEYRELGYDTSDSIDYYLTYWSQVSSQREVTLREYQLLEAALGYLKEVDHLAAETFDFMVYGQLISEEEMSEVERKKEEFQGFINVLSQDYHVVVDKQKSVKNYVKQLILKDKQVNQ